jgi:DNA-binding NarL/FixJ family response regulator
MSRQQLSVEVKRAIEIAYTFCDTTDIWAENIGQAVHQTLDAGPGTEIGLLSLGKAGWEPYFSRGYQTDSKPHQLALAYCAENFPDRMQHGLQHPTGLLSLDEMFGNNNVQSIHYHTGSWARGYCLGAFDPAGIAFYAVAGWNSPMPRAKHRMLERLAQHIRSALRLQRCVERTDLNDETIEAIYDPQTKRFEHLADAAQKNHECLAQTAEQAQQEGCSVWDGLLCGVWSLIKRVDKDQHVYWVVYRNPEGAIDPRRLSEREHNVVELAALGNSGTQIALKLYLSESSVSHLMTSALLKLGLTNVTQLSALRRTSQTLPHVLDPNARFSVVRSHRFTIENQESLTESELAVAHGVLQGKSRSIIARERGVSLSTISNQLQSVYRKVGVQSRGELAAQCIT